MSEQVDYPLVGSFNNQRITNIDAERSVNVFEYVDPKGKKVKCLIFTSGIDNSDIVFTGAVGGSRGEFVLGNNHFIAFGNKIYRIDNNNVAVLLNPTDLTTNVGYIGIDANQSVDPQVIFVDGDKGYIYDTVLNTFVMITDPAFPPKPLDVCFLDGFFLVIHGGTPQFQLSMLNQGLVWGPDNVGTPSTFTMAAGSANIVITFVSPFTLANYQIGTPIIFSGGGLPAELTAGIIYYVVGQTSPATIQVSATPGGTAIVSAAGGSGNLTNNGQLQQGQINTHPGTLVACRTLHRRIFLFSQNFTEIWENAGLGTNLPFRPNRSVLMEVGTPAIGSIATGFDKMFFLSQDKDGLGSVMEVIGTQAIPVSNRALDYQLAQYANNPLFLVPGVSTGVTDARGIMIKENGIIFYRLNFTVANHTYVYNVTLSDPSSEEGKLWHEEEVLNGNRHPAQTHGYFNGVNYYGDYLNPILYIVDNSLPTNNGETIRRMRIGQAICPPGYQRTRIDRFHLDVQQGQPQAEQFETVDLDLLSEDDFILQTESAVDLILDQGMQVQLVNDNPVVYLSLSKDGGQSYYYKQSALMGKLGERTYRTVWRKLGTIPRGQAVVPKIEFFGQGPFIILGAAWVREIMPE